MSKDWLETPTEERLERLKEVVEKMDETIGFWMSELKFKQLYEPLWLMSEDNKRAEKELNIFVKTKDLLQETYEKELVKYHETAFSEAIKKRKQDLLIELTGIINYNEVLKRLEQDDD